MFLQIHFLTHYHATLLNRDDQGFAKKIRFGGVPRIRISSQCQKRHWSDYIMKKIENDAESTELSNFSFRTRHFFDKCIKDRLLAEAKEKKEDMSENHADELISKLKEAIIKKSPKNGNEPNSNDKNDNHLETSQVALFGRQEASFFVKAMENIYRDLIELSGKTMEEKATTYYGENKKSKKNSDKKKQEKSYLLKLMKEKYHIVGDKIEAMMEQGGCKRPYVGFQGALFGRFVTSDVLTRTDAPVHVIHAITTHRNETELDFFATVDDILVQEGAPEAAYLDEMELGCGAYYGYVAVDIPLLFSNFTGCHADEWQNHENAQHNIELILDLIIEAVTQVSPGAKLGATAPYARAEFLGLEVGKEQPRTLANAFLRPVPLVTENGIMHESVKALENYMTKLDNMYGEGQTNRYIATIHEWENRKHLNMGSIHKATEVAIKKIFEKSG